MMRHLLRAARKHREGLAPDPLRDEAVERAFVAGARWQAKQDAHFAIEEAKDHTVGGFFKLGTNIASRILHSVDE